MHDIDSFYKHVSISIYNIVLKTNDGIFHLEEFRIVNIITNKINIIFQFINMNKNCRRNYQKYDDLYTELILFPSSNILTINYYTYFIIGDPNSKEIIQSLELNIMKCPKLHNFLLYVYKKNININTLPQSKY